MCLFRHEPRSINRSTKKGNWGEKEFNKGSSSWLTGFCLSGESRESAEWVAASHAEGVKRAKVTSYHRPSCPMWVLPSTVWCCPPRCGGRGQTVVFANTWRTSRATEACDKKLAGGSGLSAVKGWTFQVLVFIPGRHAFISGSLYDFSKLWFYRSLHKQEQIVLALKLPVFKMSCGFVDI